MRLVLIKPRNFSPYYDPELQEPLGLEYLSASRRAAGDQVLLLDGQLHGLEDRRLARRAAAFEPDAVGFSMTTAQDLESVLAIHREFVSLPTAPRECRWVAGGNFISTEPEIAESRLPNDFTLAQFEGENALAGLAEQWSRGLNGNSSATGSRRCVGRAVENLDALPFPERPFADQILGSGWAFNLMGSRGCLGACRYCSSPGMRQASSSHWRGRSLVNVVTEIDLLHRTFGAASFNFVDEDFLGPDHRSAQRAEEFAAELEHRSLSICFSIQVRPGSLNETCIDRLVQVGLTFVFVGLESNLREDFRRWARPWTPGMWSCVSYLQERGVEVNAGVLMFHSHSTLAGIRSFAEQLRDRGLLEYRSARNRLDAMPGSVFHKEGLSSGELNARVPGPQKLPFQDSAVERFYADLVLALDPLGPPSMHALCALPPLLTAQRLDARLETRCRELRRINARLDATVVNTFFALLALHERGRKTGDAVRELRAGNLDVAEQACRELAAGGYAESFEKLRQAIRIDTEL